MSELYERIEALCKERNISVNKMCKESGAAQGSVGDLKAGRSKGLSAKNLSKIAAYFGVSTDYLIGLEDNNGLTADGWKQMASRLLIEEEVFGKPLSDVSEQSGVPMERLNQFINGTPITNHELIMIALVYGETPEEFFYPYYSKLQKEKPTAQSSDGLDDRLSGLDPSLLKILADFVELAPGNPEAAKRYLSFAVQELQSSAQGH